MATVWEHEAIDQRKRRQAEATGDMTGVRLASKWLAEVWVCDLNEAAREILSRKEPGSVGSPFKYLEACGIVAEAQALSLDNVVPFSRHDELRFRVERWINGGMWLTNWGDTPYEALKTKDAAYHGFPLEEYRDRIVAAYQSGITREAI